jgi:hypothetical protein
MSVDGALRELAGAIGEYQVRRVFSERQSRRRTNFNALSSNYVLAYRETKKPARRVKIFLKLWALQARQLGVAATTFAYMLTQLRRDVRPLLQHATGVFGRVRYERPKFIAKFIWGRFEEWQDLISLLHMLVNKDDRRAIFEDRDVQESAKDIVPNALRAMVMAHMSLSLTRTILTLMLAGEQGDVSKGDLQRMAERLGVDNVTKMSEQQLRDAVALALASTRPAK